MEQEVRHGTAAADIDTLRAAITLLIEEIASCDIPISHKMINITTLLDCFRLLTGR